MRGWLSCGSRLTYANVTATLALVVAVGGGIALAGGGNDDPQDPHPVVARQAGLTLDANETKQLLKLPGIGTLTGECNASEEGQIVFVNRSNEKLSLSSVGATHSSVDPRVRYHVVAPGEPSTSRDRERLHDRPASRSIPSSAKKVTPQAEFSFEIRGCELVARVLTIKN